MENWYALYTRPRHEKRACDILTEKKERVYLPLVKTVKQWKDRKKIVELPLFPSYLFCYFDYKNRLRILETHGVIRIVSFNNVPAIVPDWQVDALKTILQNPGTLQLENYYRQGDLVEVKSGPFKALRGTVVNRKGESRLVITIEGIMQTISVEIGTDNLEAVKSTAAVL